MYSLRRALLSVRQRRKQMEQPGACSTSRSLAQRWLGSGDELWGRKASWRRGGARARQWAAELKAKVKKVRACGRGWHQVGLSAARNLCLLGNGAATADASFTHADAFGSNVMSASTGIIYNNEMDDFS